MTYSHERRMVYLPILNCSTGEVMDAALVDDKLTPAKVPLVFFCQGQEWCIQTIGKLSRGMERIDSRTSLTECICVYLFMYRYMLYKGGIDLRYLWYLLYKYICMYWLYWYWCCNGEGESFPGTIECRKCWGLRRGSVNVEQSCRYIIPHFESCRFGFPG